MGVPGLWDLLRPAAARTSLSTLGKEAFCANRHGLRALTIGIDASIWIFHAQVPMNGENPFLRTIFYKIAALLQQPVLPVFVFDGPNKPSQKRNQTVAGHFGTADFGSRQFKQLLDACGLEWWNAPGEAEAELAVMNRQGKIDAVLSDDVDALLFGATCLLRNNSPTLSGAQASSVQANSTRSDHRNYEIFRSSAIREVWASKEDTKLVTEDDCRMAMILVALLAGGDYIPEGVGEFGPVIALALAHAGFHDFLRLYKSDPTAFATELTSTFGRIVEELRTNASRHLGRRYPDRALKLASRDVASLFPPFALNAYLSPCTSPLSEPTQGWPGFGQGIANHRRGRARNDGKGDLEGMAKACETFFEWGTKEIVAQRFENIGLLGSALLDEARQRVRSQYSQNIFASRSRSPSPTSPIPPTPSSQIVSTSRITSFFGATVRTASSQAKVTPTVSSVPPCSGINKIYSLRQDPTNNDINEYRLGFKLEPYISRIHAAMEGTRVAPKDLPASVRQELGLIDAREEDDSLPSASHAADSTGKSEARVWVPEYLMREAWPVVLESYEDAQRAKSAKEAARTVKAATKLLVPTGGRKGKSRLNKLVADGNENLTAFNGFFTQNPRCSSPLVSTETEEEVEEVEDRPVSRLDYRNIPDLLLPSRLPPITLTETSPSLVPTAKVKGRPAPTSSLSSLTSSNASRQSSFSSTAATAAIVLLPSRRIALSSSSPPPTRARRRAKVLRIASSASSPPLSAAKTSNRAAPQKRLLRAMPMASSVGVGGGSKDQAIDLCSSDDEGSRSAFSAESPSPLRRSPRSATTKVKAKAKIPAPAISATTASPSTRRSGKTKETQQTLLALPVVMGSQSSQPTKSSKSSRPSRSAGVVTQETETEIWIDLRAVSRKH